ncbi:hypothetical protein ACFWR9_42660 [Streptomyces sp. NPDC058534]|uniref:hypothetical protein n=1 Tax=Streptomyces sp. NPDC058534 TaxID=3346541 RepID=UPI003658A885
MARNYATAADYQQYTGQTPPAGIEAELAKASRMLEADVFRLSWFEADADGLPSKALVKEAFANAVCAQAAWWDELGDSTGAAAAGWGSVKLGSASMSRPEGNTSGSASAAREIAPEVWDVLGASDLTSDVFRLGAVVTW